MKKTLVMMAAAVAIPASGWAADPAAFNCDYQPSYEVAPGIYGKMSSPVQSKFNLSIGGFVRLDYAYNSVNLGANGFQSPDGAVPSKGLGKNDGSNAANQNQSILTARTSRHVMSNLRLSGVTSSAMEACWILTLYRTDDSTRPAKAILIADVNDTLRHEAGRWKIRSRGVGGATTGS